MAASRPPAGADPPTGLAADTVPIRPDPAAGSASRRRVRPAATEPDVAALLDGWASAGHGSLPRRLAHAVRVLIDSGVLAHGCRLPPERALARQLAVGRNTVTQALDELRRDGRITSIQGSGSYVTGGAAPLPVGTRVAEHLSSGRGIDLAKGDAPDLSHLPPVGIEMWQLDATCGGAAVHAAGLPAMREVIAAMYANGGPTGRPRPTTPGQIHVTAGSHQASALLVAALAARGQAVAVAELSYPGIFDVFDACGVRAAPVRMDRAGLIPESLDRVLRVEHPAALYIQAGPQIPTGQVTPVARLRSLAAIIDRFPVTVIEDTTVAAMVFDGPAPMLADHCRLATVVSTGSLSKVCWSGIRLGWFRGPEALVERTILRHLGADLGPSVPSQILALQLLPRLEEIAAERRRRLELAVDAALEQLADLLPEVAISRPDGGSVLWLQFPIGDSAAVVDRARRVQLHVAPGSIHAADKAPGPFIRIDVDRPPGVVREGIARLARVWAELDECPQSRRTSKI